MAVKDITSLRPAYLSWTLFRDHHYTVFDHTGEACLFLVCNKGQKRSYYIKPSDYDSTQHSIVYEDHADQARYWLGVYTRECTDLFDTLRFYQYPAGNYSMSVVDASGKRLYTFEFTLTE